MSEIEDSIIQVSKDMEAICKCLGCGDVISDAPRKIGEYFVCDACVKSSDGMVKPMMKIAAGENFHTRVEGIDVLFRNLSHNDYRVHLEVEKIPEPVVTIITMDWLWLFDWATCIVKGADPEQGWFQSEFEPELLEGGGWHTLGRFEPIPTQYEPIVPEGFSYRKSLTFVPNKETTDE